MRGALDLRVRSIPIFRAGDYNHAAGTSVAYNYLFPFGSNAFPLSGLPATNGQFMVRGASPAATSHTFTLSHYQIPGNATGNAPASGIANGTSSSAVATTANWIFTNTTAPTATSMARLTTEQMSASAVNMAISNVAIVDYWNAVDYLITCVEPIRAFLPNPSQLEIVTDWPNYNMATAGATADEAEALGVILLGTAGSWPVARQNALLRAIDEIYSPTLSGAEILGQGSCDAGLVQLSLLDAVSVVRGFSGEPDTWSDVLPNTLDLACFMIQAGRFDTAGFDPTSGEGFVPFLDGIPNPRLTAAAYIRNTGAGVLLPGGWPQVGKYARGNTAAAPSAGARVLRNTQLANEMNESPIARLPGGTNFLVVRKWNFIGTYTPLTFPSTYVKLQVNLW